VQQQAEAAATDSAAAKNGLCLSAGKPAAGLPGAEAAEAVDAFTTVTDAAQNSHTAEEAAAAAAAEPMENEQQEDLAHDAAGDEDVQNTHDEGTAAVYAASSHAGLTEAADAEDASTAAAGPSSGRTSQQQQQQGAEAEAAAAPAAKSNLVSAIRSFVQGIPKKEPAAPAQGKVKTKVGVLIHMRMCWGTFCALGQVVFGSSAATSGTSCMHATKGASIEQRYCRLLANTGW
jgi:hypothetical protein